MGREGPKWGWEGLFPANPDLADILGRTDFDFENFQFLFFFDPKFPDFSESCAPRKMMQNGIDEILWGQTFKNTPYFNLRVADFWKP